MVFVRDGRPEERHDPVTKELVDRALEAVHRSQDDLECAIHNHVDVFGIQLLGHGRETRHVREHYRYDLALALDGALGRENFLGEVLGGVSLRGREAAGRRYEGCRGCRGRRWGGARQPLTAFVTELVGRRVDGLTSGTERLQSRPALPAELSFWGIRVPALGTLHPGLPWVDHFHGLINGSRNQTKGFT